MMASRWAPTIDRRIAWWSSRSRASSSGGSSTRRRVARLVLVPRAQLHDQRQMVRELLRQLVEAEQRRIDGRLACHGLLAVGVRAGHDAEAADEPRQRKALADERGQDYAIGQEDDQVAAREFASGSDSAAASETTPRIPAQDTTKTEARAGRGRSPGSSR